MKLFITSIFLFSLFCFACDPQPKQNGETEQRETIVSLEEVWSTDTVFRTPESVLFDEERDLLYVSNINGNPDEKNSNGFISKLSLDGEVIDLEWVTGLHAPKGMGILNGSLFVTDIDELVEIDIENSTIKNRYAVEGSAFLNDITIADDVVYFSESQNGKIYRFVNDSIEVFLDTDVEGSNGLFFDGDQLLALTNGDQIFKAIDLDNRNIDSISSFDGHGDGVVAVNDTSYLLSDWEGQVFYYALDGEMQNLLNTKDQNINAADIEFIKDENLLLVPTFFDNRVVAYQLITTQNETVQE